MRQQFNWFFAAVFIALFSTFSLVAHTQAHDVNSGHAPTELHTPALANAKGVVESLSLGITPFENNLQQSEKLPDPHLDSLWFNTLYHPLTLLEISYEQNLTTLFILQQNIAAHISEHTLLILVTAAFLPSDTSATHYSLLLN